MIENEEYVDMETEQEAQELLENHKKNGYSKILPKPIEDGWLFGSFDSLMTSLTGKNDE
jgi:hypothetical protein